MLNRKKRNNNRKYEKPNSDEISHRRSEGHNHRVSSRKTSNVSPQQPNDDQFKLKESEKETQSHHEVAQVKNAPENKNKNRPQNYDEANANQIHTQDAMSKTSDTSD